MLASSSICVTQDSHLGASTFLSVKWGQPYQILCTAHRADELTMGKNFNGTLTQRI